MNRIAKFEKVSFEQFIDAFRKFEDDDVTEEDVRALWESIRLPERATTGSAGYDFFAPYCFSIPPREWITIPTGIRCRMKEGWALVCMPKSGLGFKFGVALRNTIGLIDADYYYSDNEGHIMAKISAENLVHIHSGKAFMQGVFLPFGITEDDAADGVRNGGFGSTEKVQ